jgi:hypothetical protein
MKTIEPTQLSNTNGGCAPVCAPVCAPCCPVPVAVPAYRMAYPGYGFARAHAWGYGAYAAPYAAPAPGWWAAGGRRALWY